MNVNKPIIVSAFLLMAGGAYTLLVMKSGNKTTITRIIIGGYLLAIVASLADLVSPDAGFIAGRLLWLAVLTMALFIAPDVAGRISTKG